MKTFRTTFFALALCLFTTLMLTVKVNGQTKANANFDAGVVALNSNNMTLAHKKFLLAAKEGHADSQFNIALMNEKGIGTVKNEKEAVAWYNKSAEQGNMGAQFNLGVLYENGKGAPVDFAKANKWYRKAALQGDGLAIGNLGMLYLRGQGVQVNKVAGMSLLLLSVEIDQSPENNARNNITATRGLSTDMINESQKLCAKMSQSKNVLVPLDQYLKSSVNNSAKKK